MNFNGIATGTCSEWWNRVWDWCKSPGRLMRCAKSDSNRTYKLICFVVNVRSFLTRQCMLRLRFVPVWKKWKSKILTETFCCAYACVAFLSCFPCPSKKKRTVALSAWTRANSMYLCYTHFSSCSLRQKCLRFLPFAEPISFWTLLWAHIQEGTLQPIFHSITCVLRDENK